MKPYLSFLKLKCKSCHDLVRQGCAILEQFWSSEEKVGEAMKHDNANYVFQEYLRSQYCNPQTMELAGNWLLAREPYQLLERTSYSLKSWCTVTKDLRAVQSLLEVVKIMPRRKKDDTKTPSLTALDHVLGALEEAQDRLTGSTSPPASTSSSQSTSTWSQAATVSSWSSYGWSQAASVPWKRTWKTTMTQKATAQQAYAQI